MWTVIAKPKPCNGAEFRWIHGERAWISPMRRRVNARRRCWTNPVECRMVRVEVAERRELRSTLRNEQHIDLNAQCDVKCDELSPEDAVGGIVRTQTNN